MSPISRLEQLRRLSREHLLAEIRRVTGNPKILLWEMVAYGDQYRPVRAGTEAAQLLGVNIGDVVGYELEVPLGMGQTMNASTGIDVLQNDPPFADPFSHDSSAKPQLPAGDRAKMKDPRIGGGAAELECEVKAGIEDRGSFHVAAMNHGPSTSPSQVLSVSAEVRTGSVDFYGKGETATNSKYYRLTTVDFKKGITYPTQRENPSLEQIGPQKSGEKYNWTFKIGSLPPRAGTMVSIPYFFDRSKGKEAGVFVEATVEGELPPSGPARKKHADSILIQG